ncbi:MAG TPA: hypothetical protein VII06_03150 [Chloroflexota bacterium]|jgi:hypothetical protein
MFSAARLPCRPADAPRRRAARFHEPTRASGRHQRVPLAARAGRCSAPDALGVEPVLVGSAPRPRPLAQAPRAASDAPAIALAEQLPDALALLMALVTLIAALCWLARPPTL